MLILQRIVLLENGLRENLFALAISFQDTLTKPLLPQDDDGLLRQTGQKFVMVFDLLHGDKMLINTSQCRLLQSEPGVFHLLILFLKRTHGLRLEPNISYHFPGIDWEIAQNPNFHGGDRRCQSKHPTINNR